MSALYTPQMLALSAELSRYPLSDIFTHKSHARSSVCGSAIEIGFNVGPDAQIERIGMKVSACAVGQSSAAILAGSAQGKSLKDIEETLHSLKAWLAKDGPLPETWPRLSVIEGALDHPGRHGALLLPWDAAVKALSATQ